MSEPTYSLTTERIYARLPETYRNMDANNEYRFKTFISALGDQYNDLEVLMSRFMYIPLEERAEFLATLSEHDLVVRPPSTEIYGDELGYVDLYSTSDFTDARTADDAWLPWIATILGVKFGVVETSLDKRLDIIRPTFTKGTQESFTAVVTGLLTGSKYLGFHPHNDGAGSSIESPATEWDVLLVTRPEETPVGIDLVQLIIDRGAKPAGIVLHQLAYNIIWSTIESTVSTWSLIQAKGAWGNLQNFGT